MFHACDGHQGHGNSLLLINELGQFVPMSCHVRKRRFRGLLFMYKAFATSGSFCMATVVKINGRFLFTSSSSGGWGFSNIYWWLNVTWTLVAKIFAVHSHVGRWNKYE